MELLEAEAGRGCGAGSNAFPGFLDLTAIPNRDPRIEYPTAIPSRDTRPGGPWAGPMQRVPGDWYLEWRCDTRPLSKRPRALDRRAIP